MGVIKKLRHWHYWFNITFNNDNNSYKILEIAYLTHLHALVWPINQDRAQLRVRRDK